MNKKDLVIVALATFCLTATLFTILPSRSGIPYDPWADVSGPTIGTEDGTINMRDISYLIQMFGTSGSTTKDVNVTNWPQYKIVTLPTYNMSWIDGNAFLYLDYPIYLGGFSRAYVLIEPERGNVSPGNHVVSVGLYGIQWGLDSTFSSNAAEGFSYDSSKSPVTTIYIIDGRISSWVSPNWSEDSHLTIKAPYMQLILKANATSSTGWLNIKVITYLRNE